MPKVYCPDVFPGNVPHELSAIRTWGNELSCLTGKAVASLWNEKGLPGRATPSKSRCCAASRWRSD